MIERIIQLEAYLHSLILGAHLVFAFGVFRWLCGGLKESLNKDDGLSP